MPLVLTLKVGQDLYISDYRFILTRTCRNEPFHLERCADGQSFSLAEDQEVEVLPTVSCSLRDDGAGSSQVRLALEAPPGLSILRGSVHCRLRSAPLHGCLDRRVRPKDRITRPTHFQDGFQRSGDCP